MSRDVLESVPDLAELLSALKAADLADVVWACVGGVPANYLQLVKAWKKAGGPGADLEAVVERFVRGVLDTAMRNRRLSVAADPRLEVLYAMFLKQDKVPEDVLETKHLTRPSPDNVLRVRGQSFIPTDAATALVLRFALKTSSAPTLRELKELLRGNPPPTASG
jgi:hypothetical protein